MIRWMGSRHGVSECAYATLLDLYSIILTTTIFQAQILNLAKILTGHSLWCIYSVPEHYGYTHPKVIKTYKINFGDYDCSVAYLLYYFDTLDPDFFIWLWKAKIYDIRSKRNLLQFWIIEWLSIFFINP